MRYDLGTKILKCPYCLAQCQFTEIIESKRINQEQGLMHVAYYCANCNSLVTTVWKHNLHGMVIDETNFFNDGFHLTDCHPSPNLDGWKPRVNLSLIANNKVRDDFKEAINCYNNNLYNACMVMARRAIQQEMLAKKISGKNLYEQIQKTGISKKFKDLLQKVKNFGNHGAHPDFGLFDSNGTEIESKEKVAELSLEFLDRYFMEAYEIDELIAKAPKTERELERKN